MLSPSEVSDQLRICRVIPVVNIPDASCAEGLGKALLAGGLPCVEVLFRSGAAAASIETLASMKGLLVGAGTVRSVEQAKTAERAGAHFVVSPGIRQDVVEYCVAKNIAVSPGVCTPTEMEWALDLGAEVLKFFPAEAMGGTKTLGALGAVYPTVPFIPTGGINDDNLGDYLVLKNVLACGGSWIAPSNLLAERRFDEIEQRAKRACEIVAGL